MSESHLSGVVLRLQSGFYYVHTSQGLVACSLRGRMKQNRLNEDLVAVGDRVHILLSNTESGVIESIEPRRNSLVRLAPSARGEYQQVILSNLDLLVCVFACAQPEPHLRMLDRFLVIAEKQCLACMIVANKVDLVGEEKARLLFDRYPPLGYQVVYSSASTGEGVDQLKCMLWNKTAAFTGPSGVGKTSLLNALQPGLGNKVRQVSGLTSKGRHATVVRELFALNENTYLADLPGMREVGLWDIQPEELDAYFPEIKNLVQECKFNNCTHSTEPGCAVRQAASQGQIHADRYQSYLNMRAGIKEKEWD